jgi:hypothetical protein
MTDTIKYNPYEPLGPHDVEVIGRALVSYVGHPATNISAMGPEIIAYCAKHDKPRHDVDAVLRRELGFLRDSYAVMERFVVMPMPLEMFTTMAKEGWDE